MSVVNSKLPGKGLIAGTFIGQQVLKATTGNVTIPVVVTVGDPVFVQLPTVTFSTTVGVNPAPQVISVASTSTAIRFTPITASGKGGNWLSISPSGTACCYTPTNETVSVECQRAGGGNLRWRDQRHRICQPCGVDDDSRWFSMSTDEISPQRNKRRTACSGMQSGSTDPNPAALF